MATSGILRPFVPSRDFELSQEFYSAIGFQVRRKSEQIALISLGDADTGVSFLLQDFYVPALAENLMLQIVVPHLSVWWNHLASLQLDKLFSVKPPKPPAREEWGGRNIAFVPGTASFADGSGKNTMRLSYSLLAEDVQETGVRILHGIMEEHLQARASAGTKAA